MKIRFGKASGPAPGSVSLTYAELEALLQNCRWGIESAPAGYEALPPEQAEIADAYWHRGMEQLSTALLNYWYDQGASPPAPNITAILDPQQTAMATLKSQGFRFTNWIPAKPDANAITGQYCAVMVRKTKNASEYCQVHPDGSIIDGSII